MRFKVDRICRICEHTFRVRSTSTHMTCSHDCSLKYRDLIKPFYEMLAYARTKASRNKLST